MDNFNEASFKKKVDDALVQVRKILDTTRQPQIAEKVDHQYVDKYLLADFLSNSTLGALLTCLELLGLTAEGLAQISEWAQTRSITLRLKAE